MIDVTIDHAALPLAKLYELVRHNRQTTTVHYTLPAALIAPGMSTDDGQDITDVRIDDLDVLFDTVTPGYDGVDGRIRSTDEPVALATFPDTELRDGHEYAAASITGLHLSVPGRPQIPMTATVTFIEVLEDGFEIEHKATYTPAEFPGDGTVFDTAEQYEHYLDSHDEELWDLVAEDDRKAWRGAKAYGVDLAAYPLEQRVEIQVRLDPPRASAPEEPAADTAVDGLGGLTFADLPPLVRVLAVIADNTDPESWERLLSSDQQQLIDRVCRARKVMVDNDRAADRAPRLPELTGHVLERLCASAGLDPIGTITVRQRHVDLIVDTAVEEGLLPAGATWSGLVDSRPPACYLIAEDRLITIDPVQLNPARPGSTTAVKAARHILTVVRAALNG